MSEVVNMSKYIIEWDLLKLYPRLDITVSADSMYENLDEAFQFLNQHIPYMFRSRMALERHYKLPIKFHLPSQRRKLEKILIGK